MYMAIPHLNAYFGSQSYKQQQLLAIRQHFCNREIIRRSVRTCYVKRLTGVYEHRAMAAKLNIALGLTYLFEGIYEAFDNKQGPLFGYIAPELLPPGADTTHVESAFYHGFFTSLVPHAAGNPDPASVVATVADMFARQLAGHRISPEEWALAHNRAEWVTTGSRASGSTEASLQAACIAGIVANHMHERRLSNLWEAFEKALANRFVTETQLASSLFARLRAAPLHTAFQPATAPAVQALAA